MKSLKNSAIKHPVLHGLLVILIFEISMILLASFVSLLCPPFFTQNGDFLFQGTVEAFLCAIGIGLAALYGYSSIWNEKGVGLWKGFLVGMYFIVISVYTFLLFFVDGILQKSEWEVPWKMVVFAVCVFLIGLCEETFYRGVLANFFYDKYAQDSAGVWTATIASGIMFGLMHLFNMLGATDTQYIVGVLVQTVSACAMGVALSAIYFRSRNIWALVLIHGFVDFCAAFSAGFFKGGSLTETIGSYTPEQMLVSIIPYVILALVLLRPAKMKEILNYRREKDGLAISEEKVTSSKKNKTALIITVVISTLIVIGMYAGAVYLDKNPSSVVINDIQTFDTNTSAVREIEGGFVSDESRAYTVVVKSLPSESAAYATVMIYDGNELVVSKTYGGRCSESFEITMEQGRYYSVVVRYDYAGVQSQEDFIHSMFVQIN